MAFFGVTVETIEKIWPIEGADFIELARCKGMSFQFVIKKGDYQVRDRVLYFPLDSLIPGGILEKLGLEGKLSGKEKNRVKTCRFKKCLSQGLIAPLNICISISPEDLTSEDLTNYLGVKRYEPPVIFSSGANLGGLPFGMSAYDLEGADRYPEAVESMLDKRVWISEKMEGNCWSLAYRPIGDQLFVNTHYHSVLPIEGKTHSFWAVAEKQGIIQFVKDIAEDILQGKELIDHIILFGEMIGPGIQRNIYQLKEHKVLFYDIKVDGRFVGCQKFCELFEGKKDWVVPTLSWDRTLGEFLKVGSSEEISIQEASNGTSIIYDTRREGIVVKPFEEEYSSVLQGRLVIKQRSPNYLSREK